MQETSFTKKQHPLRTIPHNVGFSPTSALNLFSFVELVQGIEESEGAKLTQKYFSAAPQN